MDESLKARLIGATVLVALAVLFIPELLSGRKAADLESKQAEGARGTRTFTIELGGPPQGTNATPPSPAAAAPVAPATSASAGSSAAPASSTTPANMAAPTTAPGDSVAQTRNASADTAAGTVEPREPTAQLPTPKPEPKPATAPGVAPPKVAETPAATSATAPATTATGPGPSPAPAIPARGGWAVQVGAFGSTDAANKLVKKLQSAGYKAYVSPVSRAGKALYRVRVGPVAERAAADSMVDGLKAKGLPATVVAND